MSRPTAHVASGNGRPVAHPCCSRANFGIAEPVCYRANLLDQARILPRAVRQVRSNKRARGRHEIARPLRRERENSWAGSKASRTAQIIRLAPDRTTSAGGVFGRYSGHECELNFMSTRAHLAPVGAHAQVAAPRRASSSRRCGCCAAQTSDGARDGEIIVVP